jgi:hypothetical protein
MAVGVPKKLDLLLCIVAACLSTKDVLAHNSLGSTPIPRKPGMPRSALNTDANGRGQDEWPHPWEDIS